MEFYRLKPTVIKAVQWKGDNHKEIYEFFGHKPDSDYMDPSIPGNFAIFEQSGKVMIKYKDGGVRMVSKGEYILDAVMEYKIMSEELFNHTYESIAPNK